jgi:hypothetical protein
MHVARYVVRAGARQRTAIGFLRSPTFEQRGPLLTELLEAAGALNPQVLPWPERPSAALPVADVLLFGATGETPEALAEKLRSKRGEGQDAGQGEVSGAWGPQIWTFDSDALLSDPGPGIVDAVEALIRIVMPEALGANGTPPSSDLAVRLR